MASKKHSGDSSLTEAAKKMGKKGGTAGGPARAKALVASERSYIASLGGKAKAKKRQRGG